MTSTHKYNRSEGCCICATKNSTSQFRPWYDHYSEETYCRVFNLETLAGRRGYVCNPCVLYIKRAIHTLDNPSAEKPTDHTKRLDSKLKGSVRPVITDVFQPGTTHNQSTKEPSIVTRVKKIQPRYVFLGKPYLRLASSFQLMPAGPWQDPKNFLEDEDDAEKDLKFYRRVTLRKGEKTLKQKAEEEKMQEVLEDEMLFGKKRTTQKKQEQNCGRGKSSEPDRKKQAQGTVRKYGTRANTSKEQKFASKVTENDSSNEDTDSSEETTGYNGDGGEMEDDWTSADKDMNTKSAPSPVEVKDTGCQIRKKNRRVMKEPVKNLKPRQVSFMDCSYWQKFPMCCFDIYMGEGRHAVLRPRSNFKQGCPTWQKQLAEQQQLKEQQKVKDAPKEDTAVDTEVMQDVDMDRESVALSQVSSGDDLSVDIAMETEISPEMETDRESESLSQMSSGDDLNEDRTNFTSSPVVEDSLPLEEFHCQTKQVHVGQGSHIEQGCPTISYEWKSVL